MLYILNSFIHFRAETLVRWFYNLRFDNVFSSGWEDCRFFLERFSFVQNVVGVFSLSNNLISVRIVSRFAAVSFVFDWLSFVPRSISRPSLGALICFAPRFRLCSFAFLLFHAVVPGLLPPALLCSAQWFPLYWYQHSFVCRDIFICVYLLPHAHFL